MSAMVVAFSTVSFKPERARRRLGRCNTRCGFGLVRIGQYPDDCGGRDELMHQAQPLRSNLVTEPADTRYVAARPIEIWDEPGLNRIFPAVENNRNRRSGGFDRESDRNAAGGGDNVNFQIDQFRCHRRNTIELAVRPAVFDRHILAVGKALLFQSFPKSSRERRIGVGRLAAQEADNRSCRLLGVGYERPCRCAANQ